MSWLNCIVSTDADHSDLWIACNTSNILRLARLQFGISEKSKWLEFCECVCSTLIGFVSQRRMNIWQRSPFYIFLFPLARDVPFRRTCPPSMHLHVWIMTKGIFAFPGLCCRWSPYPPYSNYDTNFDSTTGAKVLQERLLWCWYHPPSPRDINTYFLAKWAKIYQFLKEFPWKIQLWMIIEVLQIIISWKPVRQNPSRTNSTL